MIADRSFAALAILAAAAASGALLFGAHAFEAMGYAPCPLCLDQREAHWTALGVAGAGIAASLLFRSRVGAGATAGALALVYAVSAGLAGFHLGVEYDFWPGPATCAGAAGAGTDSGALIDALNKRPLPPACDEAAWRLFGISMAGYNFLASVGLFALTAAGAASALRFARVARRNSVAPASAKTP
jgi:disulfide bond formation protein DsbB